MGWTPITIWECELKKDRIDATMEKVIEQVRAAEPQRQERAVHTPHTGEPHPRHKP